MCLLKIFDLLCNFLDLHLPFHLQIEKLCWLHNISVTLRSMKVHCTALLCPTINIDITFLLLQYGKSIKILMQTFQHQTPHEMLSYIRTFCYDQPKHKFKQILGKEQWLNSSSWVNRMLERCNVHCMCHCNVNVVCFLRCRRLSQFFRNTAWPH